jgi:hypothetical protein
VYTRHCALNTSVAKLLVPDWGHLADFGIGLSYRAAKKIGPLNIDLSNLLRETSYGSVKISSCVLGEWPISYLFYLQYNVDKYWSRQVTLLVTFIFIFMGKVHPPTVSIVNVKTQKSLYLLQYKHHSKCMKYSISPHIVFQNNGGNETLLFGTSKALFSYSTLHVNRLLYTAFIYI